MRSLMCLVSIFTVISFPVFAQAVNGFECIELAKTIATQYTVSITNDEANALRYYASCEAADQSNGEGLSIGYSGFNFGGSYSSAHNSQLCKTYNNNTEISQNDYSYAKSIYNPALATIDKCIAAASQGWRINYLPVGTDAVALTVSNDTPSTGGELLSATVEPVGGLTCTPELPSSSMGITTTNIFSTVCRRTPKKQFENGVEVDSADDENIVLNLGQGPFVIPFRGYHKLPPAITGLQQRINNIDAQIGNIALQEQITSAKPPSPTIPGQFYEVTDRCPAGTLIVGFFCSVKTGRADLQNAGILPDNSYYCAWNFIGSYAGKPFTATGQGVCLSLKKN